MQLSAEEIIKLIVVGTVIFLIAPLFIVLYIRQYNQQKKRNIEEKKNMALQFDAELLRTQIEVQERTMQTIASDLHDNIGQLLSLTSLTLNSIDIGKDTKAAERLESSRELVKKSISELRGLAKLINGEQILEMGLGYAIQQEIDWLTKSERYTVFTENAILNEDPAHSKKDLILLRLLQEIINNILKHAEAKTLSFEVKIQNNDLLLFVKDDGKGFNIKEKPSGGMGISSMRRRAALIGADIRIDSEINVGTEIVITVQYP